MKLSNLLMLFVLPLAVAGCSMANATQPTGPSCAVSYCGSVSFHINMQCNPNGFGWRCSGTVTVTFGSAPPSYVKVRLNAGGISGAANTGGASTVDVPISGDAIACPFVNPSTMQFWGPNGVNDLIATREFNWNNPGCPSGNTKPQILSSNAESF